MPILEEIDIKKAKDLIDQGGVTIVDIRDSASFEEAHIKDAIAVDDRNIEDFLKTADKSKPLICYCYHGINSQGASGYFSENGFETVYSIIGGFEEWRAEYPSS